MHISNYVVDPRNLATVQQAVCQKRRGWPSERSEEAVDWDPIKRCAEPVDACDASCVVGRLSCIPPHHLVPMCSFCSPWEHALPSVHLQRPRSRCLRMREDAVQGVSAAYRNVVRQPSKRRGKPRTTHGIKFRAAKKKGAVQKCPSLLRSISYTNV